MLNKLKIFALLTLTTTFAGCGSSADTNDDSKTLYAAGGSALITPNDLNYPTSCVRYIGGTILNRVAEGTSDDLYANALILKQGSETVVFIEMDVVGLTIAVANALFEKLEPLGFRRDRIILASTHTHAGPDTMGLWGPRISKSGICPDYIDFLVQTAANLAVETRDKLKPVSFKAGEAPINDPGSDHPALQQDFRYPPVLNNRLMAGEFTGEDGKAVATLALWHAHPETMINSRKFSADFPAYIREKLRDARGGSSIYFSGTLGGLMVPLDVKIPVRDESGEPVLDNGAQTYVSENNEIKNRSLGYVLGEKALEILSSAKKIDGALSVDTLEIDIPVSNETFWLLNDLGIIMPLPLVSDNPDFCGSYGCVRQTLLMVNIGNAHFLALPGEILPETSLGREEFKKDWGGEWGSFTYPAMTGYRSALPQGHLLFEIGLANNELGYVVPQADFQPMNHPNYYCEMDCVSEKAEQIIREAAIKLLSGIKTEKK